MVVDYIMDKEVLLLTEVAVVMVSYKRRFIMVERVFAFMILFHIMKLLFTIIIKIAIYYHHKSHLLIA
jgi:hypothetical protein